MTADVAAIVDGYRDLLDRHGYLRNGFQWTAATGKYGPLFVGRMVYLLGYQRADLAEFEMGDFYDDHGTMLFDESNGAVSVISLFRMEDLLVRALSLDGEALSVYWDVDGTTFESPQWRHGSQPDALNTELAVLETAMAEPVPLAALMALVQLRTGAELTSEFFTVPHLAL